MYRAFFALPTTLSTSEGVITNAVYGFLSMLIKLIKDQNPNCLAVAFDKGIVTFRHDTFADYKAHRPETPDELRPQFDLIKEVLASLDIPIYEKEGYEADDILATAARQVEDGSDVFVVTSDKDAFQLIDDHIKVLTTRKGISDIVIYDKERLYERYGITPEQMPDMLGLKGDPSDNIPGVPGVGEKTATKLIQEYGSMEKIYDNVDNIKGDKLKENLRNFKEQAEVSKELAKLHFETPVDFDLNKCKVHWDLGKAQETFSKYEFNTLFERLRELTPEEEKEAGFKPEIKQSTFSDVKTELDKAKTLGLDFLISDGEIKSILLCFDKDVFVLDAKELESLKPYLENESLKKTSFSAKQLIFALRFAGIYLRGLAFDAEVAAYLLEPTKTNYEVPELSQKYLKTSVAISDDELEQAAIRSNIALNLQKELEKRLKEKELKKVYEELELPLVPILAAMEYRGVGIDVKVLKKYSKELAQLIAKLEEDIYRLAGEEFNIASPAQLSKILFESLSLKPIKKTKTGYSTDSTVLAKLINEHEIIGNIMNYRELAKIKSTYVDALPRLVNAKTGRLHTSLNQTVTATGRLSSSNPNLQNIPIRTDLGKNIRKAFVSAKPTDSLVVADYSQIELRVLAHIAEDEAMIKAFEKGVDIHKATAAEVFGESLDKVSSDMRRKAKAVNFGIVYGISSFGLAQQLGVNSEEAASYIDQYFNRYQKIKQFIDNTIAQAHNQGFVTTFYNRRRPLPELASRDVRVRNFGERSAVNSVIQGSAADIIKQAMINIEKKLTENGLMTRMVLQVHDELIFEVPALETAVATPLIKKEMEEAYALTPSLIVNINSGPNWLEAK